MKISEKTISSFESRFSKTTGCWEWQAGKYKRGYGHVAILNENLAHRVAYRIYKGEIPTGMLVRHTCDNPSCVNPEHLVLGTQVDNMRDMETRKRTNRASGVRHGSKTKPENLARGESNGWAKLTATAVRKMRKLHMSGLSYQTLGRMFNVSAQAVWAAVTRKTWRHVS